MREWEWNLLEDKGSLDHVEIAGVVVKIGHRVRLCPRDGGDILDIALRGQVATIEGIEEDYEGSQHVCVVLDDDPGRDLGMMRQPGHCFFFRAAELEPIEESSSAETEQQTSNTAADKPRILVAGIGNIFLGDDGFGGEVARRLAHRNLPAEARVIDFGVRGLDLAYAFQDGYETIILIDAFPHGQRPGTVSVVKPDTNAIDATPGNFVEPHSMNPMNVLRMAKSMNGSLNRVLLVGCEPATLGGDAGCMGLSEPVENAVDHAVSTTAALIKRILDGETI
jgi:hydrogenase maturation protease